VLAGAPATAAIVEFLYVEANAGTASGGHVALRFGERVFHYQHAEGGLLRLEREDFDFFRYRYSVLENRTIHVSRIAVADDTWQRLDEFFDARFRIEEARFDVLEGRRDDVALLESLRFGSADPSAPAPQFAGGAFFPDPERNAAAAEQPVLVALRQRILREHGERFLSERAQQVESDLARLEPFPPSGPRADAAPPSPDQLPPPEYGFSQRVADLAAQQRALRALERALPLAERWRRSAAHPALDLSPPERATLAAFATRLEANLTALVASRRPDWGYPLLLGMARLVVLEESLRTGRLVVLDAFPEDAQRLRATDAEARREFFAELRDYSLEELSAARSRLLAAAPAGEGDYSDLEDTANRSLEFERGLAEGRDVRVSSERLIPRAAAPLPPSLLPSTHRAVAARALPGAARRALESERALAHAHGYHLLHHNCVSELFATVVAAFPPGEAEGRLGGRVGPSGRVVPFLAFRAVNREYRVVEIAEIPSYRRQRLSEMYAGENPLRVYLRESNTLTSSVYRPNPEDSFFLVFTDDQVLPRPLYGALNFAAGLGEAALGVLRLPFDRGRGLVSGAKGAFFSLPELAFFNVRKGSLEYGRSRIARTAPRLVDRRD
jgi:hypothetical protein